MGKFSAANLNKTFYYLKRNGLQETWYAARERLAARDHYSYEALSEQALAWQRSQVTTWQGQENVLPGFSIVVPVFRTKPDYLKAMIESVCSQTYPFWELILADATEDDSVKREVERIRADIEDKGAEKIFYYHLSENLGISENTNQAIQCASMEYIGLLDHDDLLTPDALFEMAAKIRRAQEWGVTLQMLYSDEDKCDSQAKLFYEPNRKEKWNYDLLLSNNYICHFLVLKRELLQRLLLRSAYDGAQDYDLVLRAVSALGIPDKPSRKIMVAHISKVLYHWRCHEASTAANPRSKDYAYEAGRRALQDHITGRGIKAHVRHLKHVGFYQVDYPEDIFTARKDLGAVGGPIIRYGRIAGGRMSASGRVYYEKLPVHYSGYLHRAVLTQDARAVDIRNIQLNPKLWELFEQITGVPYCCKAGTTIFDASLLPAGTDYVHLSLELCRAIRKKGYRILWRRDDE